MLAFIPLLPAHSACNCGGIQCSIITSQQQSVFLRSRKKGSERNDFQQAIAACGEIVAERKHRAMKLQDMPYLQKHEMRWG